MAESIKGAAAGAAASVPAIVPSVLLGAQVDALVVGLIAAVCVTIWLEPINSRTKAASAVILAALLAAYGSPSAVSWVASVVPSISGDADTLRMLLALVIGGGAPCLVPVAIMAAQRKGGGL